MTKAMRLCERSGVGDELIVRDTLKGVGEVGVRVARYGGTIKVLDLLLVDFVRDGVSLGCGLFGHGHDGGGSKLYTRKCGG